MRGKILITPLEEDQVTESGLIIPDTVEKEKSQQGEIVKLGGHRILENGDKVVFTVKVGDIVLFKKYSPDEIEVDDVKYIVAEESDLMAVIE